MRNTFFSFFYSLEEDEKYYIYRTKHRGLELVMGLGIVLFLWLIIGLKGAGYKNDSLLIDSLFISWVILLVVVFLIGIFSFFPIWINKWKAIWGKKIVSSRRIGILNVEWKIEK